MSSSFDAIRAKALRIGSQLPVEVNQRALIDKILARYASPNAVYRELFQNSNDANATIAEVHFTTSSDPSHTVTQVHYRNNGFAFRDEDWTRLRKIAEGNPAADKIGAFGVGACAMFSICEAPLVISGSRAMAFSWEGDSLLVNFLDVPPDHAPWTSFVLTPRDPTPLPDILDFGQFMCSSLTFTNSLHQAAVFVDGKRVFALSKCDSQLPRRVPPLPGLPRSAVMSSPQGVFTLSEDEGITERVVEISVELNDDVATLRARYYAASMETHVSPDLRARMHRVTKKDPPPRARIEMLVDSAAADGTGDAKTLIDQFSPQMGSGKIFVGFKTSQTTGSGMHLSAPFFPTVEREAIDLQDGSLRLYNSELLSASGGLMRMVLEHSWGRIGQQWEGEQTERDAFEQGLRVLGERAEETSFDREISEKDKKQYCPSLSGFSFAKLIHRRGRRKAKESASGPPADENEEHELLSPSDPRPLSLAESDAISLMRSFARFPATPDAEVGVEIAKGFQRCVPTLYPPVLTQTGIVRGVHGKLPFLGIEWFVKKNVVRQVVLQNAEHYILQVALCPQLSVEDLIEHLKVNPLQEEELVRLLKWWTKYYYKVNADAVSFQGQQLKKTITYIPLHSSSSSGIGAVALRDIHYYLGESGYRLPIDVPMPPTVLSLSVRKAIRYHVISDQSLAKWFSPLQFQYWVENICKHPSLTDGKPEDATLRIRLLQTLSQGHAYFSGQQQRVQLEELLKRQLYEKRCLPSESSPDMIQETELPRNLHLSIDGLDCFKDLGTFKKVSISLKQAGVTEEFLIALGVRETSVDFILNNLTNLKWNDNPKPLIALLRNMELSREDMRKLTKTKYLPEVRDKSRTFAPFELCLPNPDLTVLPFAKLLQWPSGDSHVLHERSADTVFLKKLGCRVEPPLEDLIKFLANYNMGDESVWRQGLDFLYRRVNDNGPYRELYRAKYLNTKFLPATIEDPLGIDPPREELHAPRSCYSNKDCSCLGFPVLTSRLNNSDGSAYAFILQCGTTPMSTPTLLIDQLLTLVRRAKLITSKNIKKHTERVMQSFAEIFKFLSTGVGWNRQMKRKLAQIQFIPHKRGTFVDWYRPDQVYFESAQEAFPELTLHLFLTIVEFSPFLASFGVKQQPSTEDLCGLLVSSPSKVLEKLGNKSYTDLLRRIAEKPPGTPLLERMKRTALFLGYESHVDGAGGKIEINVRGKPRPCRARLALAKEIYIVDNSQFSMFSFLAAPADEKMEQFYASCGALWISSEVQQKFRVEGKRDLDTPLTIDLCNRIQQRKKLLMSNQVTRSPIDPTASELLSSSRLSIREAAYIKAIYTLRGVSKCVDVTSAAVPTGKRKQLILFVTQRFTWNHVGHAVGGIIFSQCSVPDAFFIGMVLQASIGDLKAQGFPIDEDFDFTSHNTTEEPHGTASAADVYETKSAQRKRRFAKFAKRGKDLGKGLSIPMLGVIGIFASLGSSHKMQGSQRKEERSGLEAPATTSIPNHTPVQNKDKPSGVMWTFNFRDEQSSPESDVDNQGVLSDILKRSVQSSMRAERNGVFSLPRQVIRTSPETFEACEIKPGLDVKPIDGPHNNGRTLNGILVFAAREAPESEQFIEENWDIVEAFAALLTHLCDIYSLSLESVAIFHEPFGRTHAFNSRGSLYFNLRFFASLNKGIAPTVESYCFWFTTMAHELAHNISMHHDQKHGYFTQRYVSDYLPKFMREVRQIPDTLDEPKMRLVP